jgi:hypothetical protein
MIPAWTVSLTPSGSALGGESRGKMKNKTAPINMKIHNGRDDAWENNPAWRNVSADCNQSAEKFDVPTTHR